MNDHVAGPRRITVVIPCHNEETAVENVVHEFRAALPEASIIVVDNASSDATAARAERAGARVLHESRLGKGFALASGFWLAQDADLIVMVDGDGTYPADGVADLIAATDHGADMAIGTRLESPEPGAFRAGHTIGNRIFNGLVRILFGVRTNDLFSGYRVLTRRLLDASPLIAQGFEIETELSLRALVGGFRVAEVPIRYRARPDQTKSKLRTVRDGYRILLALVAFFRDYRPLTLFGLAGIGCVLLAFITGILAVSGGRQVSLTYDPFLAILAVGLALLGVVCVIAGMLLSSIARRSLELTTMLTRRPGAD